MATTTTKNPPTREILDNHELAWRTINQHNTDLAVFDQANLARLKRFAMDPSHETQRWVLEQTNSIDLEGTPEERIGTVAADNGDLVGLVVARYGKVTDDHHTFYPSEVKALREWFESGGVQ